MLSDEAVAECSEKELTEYLRVIIDLERRVSEQEEQLASLERQMQKLGENTSRRRSITNCNCADNKEQFSFSNSLWKIPRLKKKHFAAQWFAATRWRRKPV